MRLGIISDTHGHVELTRPAVRMLESLEVDAVLHCGDIGSMAVVELFAAWPTHFVFGNCDDDYRCIRGGDPPGRANLPRPVRRSGIRRRAELPCSTATNAARFREAIDSGDYELVCYGHTHVAAIDRHGDTLVRESRRNLSRDPHSIAVVELPAVEATIIEL